MSFQERWSINALDDLESLEKSTIDRITLKVKEYCSTVNPFAFAKPLQGNYKGLFRFRIGDYRAIFRKESDGTITILLILRVQHRKDIYE